MGQVVKQPNGFTLIEVLIGLSIIVFVSLASTSGQNFMEQQIRSLEIKMRLFELQTSIVKSLDNNSNSFKNTLLNLSNTNFSCFQTPTDCSTASGLFSLYLADGQVFVNHTNNHGFTKYGTPCTDFNSSGNNDCPIRIELNWTPVCPASSCHGANLNIINIDFKAIYSPDNGPLIDTSIFNLSLYRKLPTFPSTGLPYISTWQVNASESITLPLPSGFNYDAQVDWGDGTSVSNITSWDDSDRIHVYSTSGTYTITISGTLEAWSFNNSGDKDKIRTVIDLGDVGWINLEGAFYGCNNLTNFEGGNISNVTSIRNMFKESPLVTPDTSGWETGNIINMSGAFRGASSANPDTSNWDTSQVQYMTELFYQATVATPDTSGWDTSQVFGMAHMFAFTDYANPVTNGSGWSTANVSSMRGMFWNAIAATPNTSTWNTDQVSDMGHMFFGASNANPNFSNWNFVNVADISNFLLGSGISNPNYNTLLIRLEATNNLNGLTLDVGTVQYTNGGTPNPKLARDHMTGTHGWTINDGGEI